MEKFEITERRIEYLKKKRDEEIEKEIFNEESEAEIFEI
jgi:hypothetical protein